MTNRINLISGPRNISTALMYSFGNRNDTSVVDEPLYGYYLDKHPSVDHPGREEILKAQSVNLQELKNDVFFSEYDTANVFFKNMAHHFDGLDLSFLLKFRNVFLIRSPKQLIASFAQVIPNPTILDIGLKLEYEIFEFLTKENQEVIVLDSNEVLKNPSSILTQLCAEIEIPFSQNMLSWNAGPRVEDGVWAPHWYRNVHQSTSFKKQKTSSREFPERLNNLLEEAQVYYNLLSKHTIKAK